MKKKSGLEKLMKTKAELRELGGRVLLGDYPADAQTGDKFCGIDILSLTVCRPGFAWALNQIEGFFADYPDMTEIMEKLILEARRIAENAGLKEKNIMLAVICEAEGIVEEKMSGRLARIMKSVTELSRTNF